MSVTASFGIATTDEVGENVEPEGVVDVADRALYAAKDAGRNCVYVNTHDGFVLATDLVSE